MMARNSTIEPVPICPMSRGNQAQAMTIHCRLPVQRMTLRTRCLLRQDVHQNFTEARLRNTGQPVLSDGKANGAPRIGQRHRNLL